MTPYQLIVTGASALCFVTYALRRLLKVRSRLPVPPGPKGLPIIGNLKDVPESFAWFRYHDWCKEFDTDILYLNVAGTNIIVLDTAEVATELLEKRSSLYSGRARLPMINELMGWDINFGFMPYGNYWRRHRKLMHQWFHPTAAKRWQPQELKASRNLLARFLDYPDNVIGNFRHMAGETIMSIAYGIDVQPRDDPYIAAAEQAIHPFFDAAVPGAFLVDTVPALKHVPSWLPGAGFQTKAREWRKLARDMIQLPFDRTKREMSDGTARDSFTMLNLQQIAENDKGNNDAEDIVQHVAGSLYIAGSDTTSGALASCILGLLENPMALKKAQAEIDSVLKPGHLPDFDDEPLLPYVTAVVKEMLRWREVAPIAVPHFLSAEDEYNGYRLPAGSLVVANAWAMLHDERVYPEPFKFNPDRFIKDGKIDETVGDPAHACWGFGRRICPGRFMAYSSMWIAIASMMAAFNIEKAVDEDGYVIEPVEEYESSLVPRLQPFKCRITPRSEAMAKLIRASVISDLADL